MYFNIKGSNNSVGLECSAYGKKLSDAKVVGSSPTWNTK